MPIVGYFFAAGFFAGAFAAGFFAGAGSGLWMRDGACFSQSVDMSFPFVVAGSPLAAAGWAARGSPLLALEGLDAEPGVGRTTRRLA